MKICVVTPASGGSLSGNRTTAHRWGRLLRELGHDVEVAESWDGQEVDALIALHARKSFPSIERYRAERPDAPLVVAMTGTDVYRDLATHPEVEQALGHADGLVVLQPRAIDRLPIEARPKARVIYQSATPVSRVVEGERDGLRICVLSHLRPIKDPLLVAEAVRLLPPESRLRVTHAGASLDERLEARARHEHATNGRYEWLGGIEFDDARRLLADSDLLVLSSLDEGGANVISEAIVAEVPPLSTDIPGSVGLLGEDYPGLYPVGDAAALAELLTRLESDPEVLEDLRDRCRALRPRFAPEAEREAWRGLLEALNG